MSELDKYRSSQPGDRLESFSKKQGMRGRAALRSSPSSASRVVADHETVELIANSEGENESRVIVNGTNGITLRGQVGFSENFWNVRYGGIFQMNPLAFIPSTIGFPNATMIFTPPLGAVARLGTSIASISAGVV